ncbi:putative nucleotidyltransferase, ribonuclease H [Tanacetum coccineum]
MNFLTSSAREIEYGIEYNSRVLRPISKALYVRHLLKLKEFKGAVTVDVGRMALLDPVFLCRGCTDKEVVCEVFEVRVLVNSSRFPRSICICNPAHYGPSKVKLSPKWPRPTTVDGVYVYDVLLANGDEYEDKSNRYATDQKAQGTTLSCWSNVQKVEDGKHKLSFMVDDDGVVWFNQNVHGFETELYWCNGMKQECGYVCIQMYDYDSMSKLKHQGLVKRHDAFGWFVDRQQRLLIFLLNSISKGTMSERTIQTLEDMLRACALEWMGSWDEYLCLVEFAYNNSWHASIKAAPFELLYGRKCRAPICWDKVGERLIEGLELIEITNEKVAVAKEKLKDVGSLDHSID